MTVSTAVVVLPRRVASWAARRALARNSLTGIELGCSLCAAVWFSAGTPLSALAGGAALGGGYLAQRVGRQLTGDVLDGWLGAAGALLGELAVYAGLAVGAASGQRGVWPLAISSTAVTGPGAAWRLATGAAVLLGLRELVRWCRPAPTGGSRPEDPAEGPARPGLLARAGELLGLPAGERAVVITATAACFGTRFSLLVLTGWGALALAWAIAGPRPGAAARTGAGPGRAAGAAASVAACRDDGPIARFAGQLVQGQLVPLPPAVAGLIATVLLAALGLGDLAGPVLLTPVAAMLLAAPGSAHPHNRPLDWLAPTVVQAGQYIYLAALGFATRVPGPVTFALIGLVALRQLDVAYQASRPLPPGPRGGMGWEGRMLAAGAGAMLGIAAFSYLALAAYLGWLLGSRALTSWFTARGGARAAPAAGARRPAG
jgi:Family of unknown function (DUF5941)